MDKMGVSKSERLSPKIYSTSRIPELIKFLKYSLRTNNLNEAYTTIADLEKNVKIEIENLETDLYSSKKELELMQRAQQFSETEKIKLEEEFWRSRRECESLKEKFTSSSGDQRLSSNREKQTKERYAKVCDELKSCQKERDELNERITRLLEDQKVLSEREKTSKELCAKQCDELSKAEDEKHKMINELNNRILGSEKAAEVYEEIIKCLELMVAQMNSDVEKLKQEKSEADQNVKELRLKLLKADKTEEAYKKKFEDLTERIANAEKRFAKLLKLDVNDIPNLANDTTRSPIAVNFPRSNGENASTGNGGNWSRDDADLETSRKEKNLYNGVDIIKIGDSDDEVTEQEGSLLSSTSKRKRSTNANENNEIFLIGVQKEKRRRELSSDGPESLVNDSLVKSKSGARNQPLRGIDVSASTDSDSDDDSITSSRIDDIIGSG